MNYPAASSGGSERHSVLDTESSTFLWIPVPAPDPDPPAKVLYGGQVRGPPE